MEQIKLWKIDKDGLRQVDCDSLDFEARLEKWILDDISVISAGFMVIGSQVQTAYGKAIDILAMDAIGNLVIIELKRDKTPRDVTAQVIDYASWVKDLTLEEIEEIYRGWSKNGKGLEEAFNERFKGIDFPDEVNDSHRMIIVGSNIDDSTSRIVRYLSEEGNININAMTFSYFKDKDGHEFLVKTALIAESELEEKAQKKSNRGPSICKKLFAAGKLKVGQKVILFAAIDQGVSKDNDKINAEIVNTTMNCLKRKNDEEIYSFHGLRYKIVKEFGLKGLNENHAPGAADQWGLEDGRRIRELIDE